MPPSEDIAALRAQVDYLVRAVDHLSDTIAPAIHRQALEHERLKGELRMHKAGILLALLAGTGSVGTTVAKLLGVAP